MTTAVVVLAAGALGLLVARSWRIDYGYSIDFQAYWMAGRRIVAGDAASLYAAGGGPAYGTPVAMAANEFKNIPIVATVFAPLAALDYLAAKRVVWWAGLAALALTAVVTGLVVVPEAVGGRVRRIAACAAALFAFAPAHTALRHGQTTPLVALLVAAWLAASLRGSGAGAGTCLAGACLVKFPPLALLGLDVLRRRAASAAVCLVALAGAVLGSFALFGLDLHRQYLAGLAEHAGTVMSGHNNQSLAAIASRLTSASAVNDWTPRPIGVLPATLALAASLALGGVALAAIARTRSNRGAIRLEAAMALALGIVAFPVAWDHYFVMLAPAMIGLAAGLHERGLLRRPSWSVPLGLAALVLALPTPTRLLEATTAGPVSGLLLSVDGLAALIVFGIAAAALAFPRSDAP